jgi:signal transduction histidine kinase
MTLRTKILLIIGITFASLISLLYGSSNIILMRGYSQLEVQDTQRHVERVLNALQVQVDNLNTVALGYAVWDDSYQFISDANQSYIELNMSDLTFTDNQLNLVAFLNNDLQIVYEKAFDLNTGQEISVPSSFNHHLLSDSPLVTHSDIRSSSSGIVMLPEGYLLVSSHPVIKSDSTGPINGVMIWGRFLDKAQIQSLAEATGLALTAYRIDEERLPSDFQSAKMALNDGEGKFVQPLADGNIAGYTIINDINGNPAVLLRTDLPREIYAQGQASVSYFLMALLVSSGVFVVVTLLLLEKVILARLGKLSAAVTHVRTSGDLQTPILIKGDDELANLADGMRNMLAALAQSRLTLEQANNELERRVEQRTVELSETNVRLREEIVERKQAQEHLAQARDQAVEALRLKTQILANVSHDARTPLSTIMLRAELLQMQHLGPLTDKQHQSLDLILVNAKQLLDFVNNLLTEAQLNSDKIQIAHITFSPEALLEEISNSMLPLADKKSLQLKTEVKAGMPERLLSDPNRVKQILMNLLDNAIKFTDQGIISISVYCSNPTQWVLQVTDTGVGISVEAQERIFEAFWQVDGSVSRKANRGVGLGLSIVKQLTTLLQGELTVQSEIGQGSTFTVFLPLHKVQEE